MGKIFRYIIALLIFSCCSADAQVLRFNAEKQPLSVHFNQADEGQVDLQFEINELILNPVKINNDTYMQPAISGEARLLQKDLPDLPVMTRSVEIPYKGEVSFDYQVLDYEDLDIPVAPSRGHISRAQNPGDLPYGFADVYTSDSAWPETPVVISEPYLIRNCRGVTVRVCPFQYFPATETLRVLRNVRVQVYCKGDSGVNIRRSSRAETADSDPFENIYAGRFINHDTARSGPSSLSRRYAPLKRQGRMLIIAADSLAASVEPLALWRRQMGIPVDLVKLSEIGTTAEEVRAYVQGVYDAKNLVWLLLVGDGEQMPYPVADYGDQTGASDPSYAKLAGTDDYPDIFVGRFSGSTPFEISTMVERTVQYERFPEAGGLWYEYAVGIASDESGDDPGNGISDSEHMDKLRDELLAGGYGAVDRIYDPGASSHQVSEAVNDGRGLINYAGHGDIKEWSTTEFKNLDVDALTNTSAWPFIFDVACLNGQFVDEDCFAEAWIRAEHGGTPAGALAIYSSTIEQDWVPPMTAQDEFTRLLLAGDITGYGALCFNASMKMMDDWSESGPAMFNTWTVFGDPAVQVRTKKPSALSVSHSGKITSLEYEVSVAGVKGALAGLSSDGEYIGSAYTDAQGKAAIILNSPVLPRTLQLTVTAFNAIPYTSTVQGSEANLVCNPESVTHELIPGGSGSETLIVLNTGPESSVLEYSVNILPDYSVINTRNAVQTGGTRDLSGCEMRLGASEYTPGENVELILTLKNNSPDYEYISAVEMKFPETVTVNNATGLKEREWGLGFDGVTGQGAVLKWHAEDLENDPISGKAEGILNLIFSPSAKGPLEIAWEIWGDRYGSEPHNLTGVIRLEEKAPGLKVKTPNGGESWLIGSTHEIAWESVNYSGPVDIDCSADGGISWQPVAKDVDNSGSYTWTVDVRQQSRNCLLRVSAGDGSVSAVSEGVFSVYNSLDWVTLSEGSGLITGNGADFIGIEFDASGKKSGTYRAVIEVASVVGVCRIPVEMKVLPPAPEWMIWAKAGDMGSVTPGGIITVADGGSASFMVRADNGYCISQLLRNGTSVYEAAGLTEFTSSWNNVQANGNLQAEFAKIEDTGGAPKAFPGTFRMEPDTILRGRLHADLPVPATSALFRLAAPPGKGTATVSGDGSFSYTPDAGYTGHDEFTYKVSTHGGSDSAVISIDVTAAGSPNWLQNLIEYLFRLFF